ARVAEGQDDHLAEVTAEPELGSARGLQGEVRRRPGWLEGAAPEPGRLRRGVTRHRGGRGSHHEDHEREDAARRHGFPAPGSSTPSSRKIDALSARSSGFESIRGRGSLTSITCWI